MVFIFGKLLALAAVSGFAFFIINRPRIPIIPPLIPVEANGKDSRRKRNEKARLALDQMNRGTRTGFAML
jgi:hypothetical protein